MSIESKEYIFCQSSERTEHMKKEPTTAQKKEDLIFYKILILFLVCFVIEIAFLIMNRLYLYVGTFMTAHAIANVCQYVGIGLFIAGIVLAAVFWKKEKAGEIND